MNNAQLEIALDTLEINQPFTTPDMFFGSPFRIDGVAQGEIRIILSSGGVLAIHRQAFFEANNYLQANNHDMSNPVNLGSSNSVIDSGPLCLATRAANNNVRCINYIIPILAFLGAAGFSGARPNTCWYV